MIRVLEEGTLIRSKGQTYPTSSDISAVEILSAWIWSLGMRLVRCIDAVIIVSVSVCVLLVAISCLSLSQAATTTPSLHDVITQRDRSRMKQLLVAAEPYSDLETAYYITSALLSLGFSESNRLVSEASFDHQFG